MSRKRTAHSLGLLAAVAFMACSTAATTQLAAPTIPAPPDGRAELKNANGQVVGSAIFTQFAGKVEIAVQAKELPPGFHGFHVHAVGECTPPFTSAGGHLNTAGQSHPGHAADLPVLLVNADGTAEASVKSDRFALADLFDADGSALIIHADPDNYANIPDRYGTSDTPTLNTGDAGARIACGPVVR